MAPWILTTPQLVTCGPSPAPRGGRSMGDVGVLSPGALVVEGERLLFVGTMHQLEQAGWLSAGHRRLDWTGAVVPGLCDAHTHPVYAGSRLHEFALRARGATYEEIHAAGGGIAATVTASREAQDEDLEGLLRDRLERMRRHGTTTAECKSGYGLSEADERRHLALLRRVAGDVPMSLVSTFLGAHAIPPEFASDRKGYVDLLVSMLPRIVDERLADYCDVFCEQGAFTLDETRRLLTAARQAGLGLRIHAEEFTYQGSARVAAELGAVSCDHLLCIDPQDFPVLRDCGTVATLMPGTAFFLGKAAYAPARGLLDADVAVALASDFNAGSCMSESLQMAMTLGVLKMHMSPEEALVAATVNGAWAVGRGQQVGSLEVGKQADFLELTCRDYREWPYHVGVNMVRRVVRSGRLIIGDEGEQG